MATDQEWESILQIKTAGRDDSRSDAEHHPYEPTDYCVLERLANSGYITKQNTLIDYGSGKGRVSIFMAWIYNLSATKKDSWLSDKIVFAKTSKNQEEPWIIILILH